jgi:SAM-dependent methyltransferase
MSSRDANAVSVATFDKNSALYTEKFFTSPQYDKYYEMLTSMLPHSSANFVDIASGPGNVSAYVRRIRVDANILCVDLSPNMLGEAAARVPRVETLVLDCRKLGALGEREMVQQRESSDLSEPLFRQFDGAAFFFGLSYLDDEGCTEFFDGLKRILKPDSYFLLATVTGEPEKSGLQRTSTGDEVYMFYRRPKDVLAMVESHGLTCCFSEMVPSPGGAAQKTTDLVVLAILRREEGPRQEA